MLDFKEKLKNPNLKDFLKQYWIKHLSVFWSYARWEQKKDSDLDLYITIWEDSNLSLFWLQEIEDKITKELNVPRVDFITNRSVNPNLRKFIKKDLIKIF